MKRDERKQAELEWEAARWLTSRGLLDRPEISQAIDVANIKSLAILLAITEARGEKKGKHDETATTD